MNENEENNGIQITEEVVAVIAREAIKNIEGVVKVATGFAGGISEALGKRNTGKGIKVEINEQAVRMELGIVVKYGVRIPEVATKIQEKIAKDVQEMTGLTVKSVNVRVQGIENETETIEEVKAEIIEEE